MQKHYHIWAGKGVRLTRRSRVYAKRQSAYTVSRVIKREDRDVTDVMVRACTAQCAIPKASE